MSKAAIKGFYLAKNRVLITEDNLIVAELM